MSLVFVTLGVAKIVDISIAVDICRLKTAQKLSYMWADTSLSAFSIISVFIKDHSGHSHKINIELSHVTDLKGNVLWVNTCNCNKKERKRLLFMKILYSGIFIATFKRTYIQDQASPIIVTLNRLPI